MSRGFAVCEYTGGTRDVPFISTTIESSGLRNQGRFKDRVVASYHMQATLFSESLQIEMLLYVVYVETAG